MLDTFKLYLLRSTVSAILFSSFYCCDAVDHRTHSRSSALPEMNYLAVVTNLANSVSTIVVNMYPCRLLFDGFNLRGMPSSQTPSRACIAATTTYLMVRLHQIMHDELETMDR